MAMITSKEPVTIYMLRSCQGPNNTKYVRGHDYVMPMDLAIWMEATKKGTREKPNGWPNSFRYPWDRETPPELKKADDGKSGKPENGESTKAQGAK